MEKKSCPECDGLFVPLSGGGLRAHGPVHARCAQDVRNRAGTRICEGCNRAFVVLGDETLPQHESTPGEACTGVSDPTLTVEKTTTQGDDMNPDAEAQLDAADMMLAYSDEIPEPHDAAKAAAKAPDRKGPWFGAMYAEECSECDGAIFEGDRIRADGTGGYECEDCGEDPDRLIAVTRLRIPAAPGSMPTSELLTENDLWDNPTLPRPPYLVAQERPTPDEFLTVGDTPPPRGALTVTADEFLSPSPVGDAKPVISVSGQPKYVLRDHLDRYCVVLPGETELETFKSSGNPVGRTRTTTFVKAASNNKALNDWGKRNVVIGAARRRDIILQAHDLTHERDRDKLDALVKTLEEAAGSKVGSDLGTYLHDFTEYMDAGLKSWIAAPQEFRKSLKGYAQALQDAGLEPITSLIERTTIIREYGWVCGTFDRIFFHRPSGQYVIGDLKTGQTMNYGKNEIEAQLWTYAHGVNQNGIYDWNTRTWGPALGPCRCPSHDGSADGSHAPEEVRVSESVGVIVHMPVQGKLEGTVNLLWADLESGAAHAATCAEVRARPGGKMKPWGNGPAPLAPPKVIDLNLIDPTPWDVLFSQADTNEQASELWGRARAAGIRGMELNRLINLAQDNMRGKG